MSQAVCPYCNRKVMIPDGLEPGTVMQCASCQSTFLPPESDLGDGVSLQLKRKKKRRRREEEEPSESQYNVRAVIGIFVAIGLLLAGVGVFFLLQPGHADFNEAVVQSYTKFQAIVQASVNAERPPNPLMPFLKQFHTLDDQLQPLLKEVRAINAPADDKQIQSQFVAMLESCCEFSKQCKGEWMDKLKKKPNDQEVMKEMLMSLVRINQHHENLLDYQRSLATTHRLFVVQRSPNMPFFLEPWRERER
jgi:hypothetical protein